MNRATKIALINLKNSHFHLRTALFHSTPVLDRRRRTHWESAGSFYRSSSKRPNFNSRRRKKFYANQELLRNANAFGETLFQGWHDYDEFDPSSSHGSSSFRGFNGTGGFNGNRANSKGPQARGRRKGFQFHEGVEDVETIFRSAFGGNGFYFWSFINDEPPRSSSGFHSNYQTSWNWRHRLEDEDEDEDEDGFSSESDRVETNLTKDRMTLGLSGSGPLSLEDVKNAYRVCALKWHPDRHEGSSKVQCDTILRALAQKSTTVDWSSRTLFGRKSEKEQKQDFGKIFTLFGRKSEIAAQMGMWNQRNRRRSSPKMLAFLFGGCTKIEYQHGRLWT